MAKVKAHDVEMVDLLAQKKAMKHQKEVMERDIANKEREILDNNHMIELSKEEIERLLLEKDLKLKISKIMQEDYTQLEPKMGFEKNPEYWTVMRDVQLLVDERGIAKLDQDLYLHQRKILNGEEAVKNLELNLKMQKEELIGKEDE